MLKQSFRKINLLLLLFFAACSSTGVDSSDDAIIQIALSSAAQPVSGALQSCAASSLTKGQSLNVQGGYFDIQDLENFDFAIQLGESAGPPEMVAKLAEEELVIVLHPSNLVRDLSQVKISDLFSGRISNWNLADGNDAEVALWIGPPSDESRSTLERDLLAGSPVSGNARLAASPQLMLDAVSADVNAIGLLPSAWADSSVRSLASGISLPVLALAKGELSSEARAIIACLQGQQGQGILAETYAP